jgi:hypothetical protein
MVTQALAVVRRISASPGAPAAQPDLRAVLPALMLALFGGQQVAGDPEEE